LGAVRLMELGRGADIQWRIECDLQWKSLRPRCERIESIALSHCQHTTVLVFSLNAFCIWYQPIFDEQKISSDGSLHGLYYRRPIITNLSA